MPINESDIRITERNLSFLRWDPNKPGKNQGTICSLTVRVYNAFSYKKGECEVLWERELTSSQIKNMIQSGKVLKIAASVDQPLILTIQEDSGEEKVYSGKIGTPYEIVMKNYKIKAGGLQPEQLILEISIPPIDDMKYLPEDFIYYKIELKDGTSYKLLLPKLQIGINQFLCADLPFDARKEGPYLNDNFKNYFTIRRS